MNGTSTASTARGIAWLALIFSVIALLFAVSAYGVSRTKADESLDREGLNGATATTTLQDTKREIGQELSAARANVADNENYEAAAVQVSQSRVRLASAYENANSSAQAEWQELQQSFAKVEDALRTESADALTLLEQLIARVSEDIRTDQNPQDLGE